MSMMRDGTPKGYAFLKIKGNTYEFDYKVAGEEADYQIKLFTPDVVAEKQVQRYTLYANFFIGKEGDQVEVRIDGGDWKPMKYAPEVDPQYTANVYRYDGAETLQEGRRPSNAVMSTHLWKVNLPKLIAGKHQLEVRGVDMFGKTHHQRKVIEVVNDK